MSRQTKARVALLGCGTVGREVAARLVEQGDRLGVELVRVLVRDRTRDRGIDPRLLTDCFDDVLDSRPDLVIELIGGVEAPRVLVDRALRRGIAVVTANKSLIAHHGESLDEVARAHGAALAFEAAVCAGVPVIAALRQLRGDRLLSVRGVINGTCNYVLARLGAGLALDAAVREAQERGFAEPDPAADLSGRDAAEKLCVLAAAAGWQGLRPEHVACEGIAGITPEDAARARRSGRTIKLVAELDLGGDQPAARVGPVLVSREHPLAAIDGADNAVIITAALAGEVALRGPGAGPRPTASAVLGDVARLLARRPRQSRSPREGAAAPASHRHQIHIGRAIAPSGVYDDLRAHGLEPEEIDIGADGTTVLTSPAPTRLAAEAGRALGGPGDAVRLVLPILEPERARIPA